MACRVIVDIIKNYCETNNISLKFISSDWIIKLTKNNIIRYIHGYQFDLNSAGTLMICNDKSAVSEVLTSLDIPNVKHTLILPGLTQDKINVANLIFNKFDKDVVLKTNNGTGGRDVFRVTDFNDLLEKMRYLFAKNEYASISPFYEINNEYRVIILNDEVKLIYSKHRTNNWKHNLGLGAEPIITDDIEICSILGELALKASRAVNGKFVSVDIIEVNGNYLVLEINSGIMMEHFASKTAENYKITEKIYQDAIKSMLEE